MAIGPCLCGDPYCPHCGDPTVAELADLIDDIADTMSELIESPEEARIFELAGAMAVHAHREAIITELANMNEGDAMYIQVLESEIEQLKYNIKRLEQTS